VGIGDLLWAARAVWGALRLALVLLFLVVALATIMLALVADGGSNAYAAARREALPGARLARRVRLWLWRVAFQRYLGPPPVEVRTLREMLALSPSEFEAATATVFRGMGYQHIRVVGGTGDYCADVEASDPQGRSVVIQCKRYGPGNTVGSREVQTFLGMATVHHHAQHAILVTTSRFTANALTIERESRGRLELIDGERLAQMIQRTSRPALGAPMVSGDPAPIPEQPAEPGF
jgi:hypothetical protein